jgi:hypothetical protein
MRRSSRPDAATVERYGTERGIFRARGADFRRTGRAAGDYFEG